jgi:two-component system LytT family response regulator
MEQYNCLIIDDNEIDRLVISSFLNNVPFLTIKGVFESTDEALNLMTTGDIDVIFLDIKLPGLSGIEFRRQAMQIPVCIFISSYPEHAVESFKLDTLDFILKPVRRDRFNQMIDRLQKYLEIKEKAKLYELNMGGDLIYIKEGHQQTKLQLKDIYYLEALKDYTRIVTQSKKHCVLLSLGNLLKEPDFQSFIRIHRSYAVHEQFIHSIKSTELVLTNGCVLPVGRVYKENLKR